MLTPKDGDQFCKDYWEYKLGCKLTMADFKRIIKALEDADDDPTRPRNAKRRPPELSDCTSCDDFAMCYCLVWSTEVEAWLTGWYDLRHKTWCIDDPDYCDCAHSITYWLPMPPDPE